MKVRSTQPRRARIVLLGFAAAALTFIASPQSVNAGPYPPSPDGETSPPPAQPVPPIEQPQGLAGAVGDSLPSTGGSDPSQLVWIALSSVGAGGLIYAASSRRHGAAKTNS